MKSSISLAAFALVLAAALATSSCGGDDPFQPPTGPTPVPQTEVLSGALNVNGARTHPFVTQAGGTVTATLTTIDPDVRVGLSLGTWNGLACQIIIANDSAVKNITVTGTASSVGNFCVRIYDVGNFTTSTSYEVSVLHP